MRNVERPFHSTAPRPSPEEVGSIMMNRKSSPLDPPHRLHLTQSRKMALGMERASGACAAALASCLGKQWLQTEDTRLREEIHPDGGAIE